MKALSLKHQQRLLKVKKAKLAEFAAQLEKVKADMEQIAAL
jgi:hypothetical protein